MTISSTWLPVSSAHFCRVVEKASPSVGSSDSITFRVWPVGADPVDSPVAAEPDSEEVEPEPLPPQAASDMVIAAARARDRTFFMLVYLLTGLLRDRPPRPGCAAGLPHGGGSRVGKYRKRQRWFLFTTLVYHPARRFLYAYLAVLTPRTSHFLRCSKKFRQIAVSKTLKIIQNAGAILLYAMRKHPAFRPPPRNGRRPTYNNIVVGRFSGKNGSQQMQHAGAALRKKGIARLFPAMVY